MIEEGLYLSLSKVFKTIPPPLAAGRATYVESLAFYFKL
jgi:hypothetical protein